MSIESRLVDIRTYLEDIASTQQQILAELRRVNGAQQADQLAPNEGAPWPDYDRMTVGEIAIALENDNEAERAAVLAYERAHKNRKGVIDALVSWNS